MKKEQLINLWMEAFGDYREDVEIFFDTAFKDGAVAIIEKDDEVVSAMYLLEDHIAKRTSDGKEYKLTYLYALAALKKYRGNGYGGATFKMARDMAFERGADIVALCPANEGLIKWYQDKGLNRMALSRSEYECAKAKDDVFTMDFSDGYKELHDKYMQYPEYAAINEDERVILYQTREGIPVEGLYFSPILF